MSRLTVLKELKLARVVRGVRNRGLRGAVAHAARRAGTLAGRALAGPHLVRINPMSYVCNHTCPMCWLQHLPEGELAKHKKLDRELGMNAAEYQAMFDGMPPGVGEINIVGGGEPLIHPEILDIMRMIKRRGWRGWLISNATLLREEIARGMIAAGWDMVRASVHAADPATYKTIQGVDRFENLKANLSTYTRLRDESPTGGKRPKLVILNVLQHANIPTIEKLFEFAHEMRADELVFEKITPISADMALSAEELRRCREALLNCASVATLPVNLDQALVQIAAEEACTAEAKPFRPARRCSVGYDQAYVTSIGNVVPCCFSNELMGNVREQTFSEIWHGEKYAKFRNRLMEGRFAGYCISNRCALKDVLHD